VVAVDGAPVEDRAPDADVALQAMDEDDIAGRGLAGGNAEAAKIEPAAVMRCLVAVMLDLRSRLSMTKGGTLGSQQLECLSPRDPSSRVGTDRAA
jgi:hypothetical protein